MDNWPLGISQEALAADAADDDDDEDDELEADAVLLAVLLLDEESEDFVSLVLLSAGSDELDLLPARASLR